MILYTDFNKDYFHLCTVSHERISWCYRTTPSKDELLCSYLDCKFKFPKYYILGTTAYNIFRGTRWIYINFLGGTNNKGYLENLNKIEI